MVVTKTETGNPGARDKIRPPTAATSAKMTDHSTVCSGEEVICTAAAPGVISKAMTNSAPTICTDCAAARPTSTAKSTEIARIGMPEACAMTGSADAKSIGRQKSTTAATTTMVVSANSHTEALETPTICPVSKVIAAVGLPGYRCRKSTESPSPKLMTTPMALSCWPLNPKTASTMAAPIAPAMAPQQRGTPKRRAAAAPMTASSEAGWPQNDPGRSSTTGGVTPESTRSKGHASTACCTKSTDSNYPVWSRKV